jgi:tetratricopeptide (TPR) repeat protein
MRKKRGAQQTKKLDVESLSAELVRILEIPEIEEISSQLLTLLDEQIFSSDEINEKDVGDLRDNYVALKENLRFYQRALVAESRGDPGSNEYLQQMSFALQKSIQNVRFNINMIVKRQPRKVMQSRRTDKQETGVIEPQIEDESKLKNLIRQIEDNRDDDRAYNELGNYYFSLGRFEDARKEYLNALSKKEDYIYYVNIGDSYKNENNWNKAIEYYEKALTITKNEVIYDALGEVYYLNGNYDKAIDYELKCMEIAPTDYQYPVNMGNIYTAKRDYQMATDYLRSALLMNESCEKAHTNLAYVLISKYDEEPNDNSIVKEAIEHYEKVMELSPNMTPPYGHLGDAYTRLNAWDQAIEYYNKAIKLDDKDDRSHGGLGTCYENKGMWDEASKHLQKAVELQPTSSYYLSRLADIYRKSKNWDKAIEYYEKSLQKDDNNPTVLNNLGLAYFFKKDYGKASSYYERAIKLDANDPIFYNNLGVLYSTKDWENWEKARINFEQALKLDPQNALAMSGMGNYYLESLHILNKALDYFQESLKLDKNDPYVISKISEVFVRLGNWDKAAEYGKLANEVAQSITPTDNTYEKKIGYLYHEKGLFLYKKGSYQEAIRELEQANRIEEYHETFWAIYLAYFALSDYKRAKENLLKAIGLKTDPIYLSALEELNSKMEGGMKI